jgi:hypothetical protein
MPEIQMVQAAPSDLDGDLAGSGPRFRDLAKFKAAGLAMSSQLKGFHIGSGRFLARGARAAA